MDKVAHDHKIAVIKACIEQGLSPKETAAVFRKHAEILHDCADALTEDMRKEGQEKTALSPTKDVLLPLLMVGALPAVGSMAAGHAIGTHTAKALAPRNEMPIPMYQEVILM